MPPTPPPSSSPSPPPSCTRPRISGVSPSLLPRSHLHPLLLLLLLLLLLSSTITPVRANTAKTIFLGPPTVNIPSAHPTLETLRLDTLTPESPSSSVIRTALNASFPIAPIAHASSAASASASGSEPKNFSEDQWGTASWFILDGLVPGQRYEVRLCWSATQPTVFRLDTFELDTVFETPGLISSLSRYSYARQVSGQDHVAITTATTTTAEAKEKSPSSSSLSKREREASVLLLRIFCAAEYFTTNKTLMAAVPPVRVDVILDPFLLNVLPRSLLPVAGYIAVVAVGSWFLAKRIATVICEVAMPPSIDQERKRQ